MRLSQWLLATEPEILVHFWYSNVCLQHTMQLETHIYAFFSSCVFAACARKCLLYLHTNTRCPPHHNQHYCSSHFVRDTFFLFFKISSKSRTCTECTEIEQKKKQNAATTKSTKTNGMAEEKKSTEFRRTTIIASAFLAETNSNDRTLLSVVKRCVDDENKRKKNHFVVFVCIFMTKLVMSTYSWWWPTNICDVPRHTVTHVEG